MTFEEFLKRSISISKAAQSTLQSTLLESQRRYLESQRREFDKYLWQTELQKWKRCDLEDSLYDIEQVEATDDEWGVKREGIWVSSSQCLKDPMYAEEILEAVLKKYVYVDESHVHDFGEKITIETRALKNDIGMSFDDVMGFGG